MADRAQSFSSRLKRQLSLAGLEIRTASIAMHHAGMALSDAAELFDEEHTEVAASVAEAAVETSPAEAIAEASSAEGYKPREEEKIPAEAHRGHEGRGGLGAEEGHEEGLKGEALGCGADRGQEGGEAGRREVGHGREDIQWVSAGSAAASIPSAFCRPSIDAPGFASTKAEVTSLKDYVGRRQEGQDKIYYITGDSSKRCKASPYLKPFISADTEVILAVGWGAKKLRSMRDFDGMELHEVQTVTDSESSEA